LLGIPVTVVMPVTAPLTKASNCKRLGATVILRGKNLEESRAHADEIATGKGLTYINGYNDLPIIAGQGTLGIEIVRQVPDVDAIVVPIGGAGLIAGVSLAIKTLRPSVQVIGVEPKNAASFSAALAEKKPVLTKISPTLADGLAVAEVGGNAFEMARRHVDRVVLVNEHEIALAILRLIELEKAVVEGAGATPLAACLANLLPELKGKNVVLPLCGGNIDTNILGRVLERGLVSDGRLWRFSTNISDRPGGLARLATILAEEEASVMEIAHDRAFTSDDVSVVTVRCVVETRDAEHVEQVRARLIAEGFSATQ
jgi:threonine dehydratase